MENKKYNRKEFISFLGKVGLGVAITPSFLMSCGNSNRSIISEGLSNDEINKLKKLVIEGLVSSDIDDLLLAKGLDYNTLIKWNDKINEADTFGFNCDFTCFIPLMTNNLRTDYFGSTMNTFTLFCFELCLWESKSRKNN